MNVYLLCHDDGSYNWDGNWIRGVYASEDDAKAAITSTDNPGDVTDHSAFCCDIEEWKVTMPQRVLV